MSGYAKKKKRPEGTSRGKCPGEMFYTPAYLVMFVSNFIGVTVLK